MQDPLNRGLLNIWLYNIFKHGSIDFFGGLCCGNLILSNGYRPCIYYYKILFLQNLLYIIQKKFFNLLPEWCLKFFTTINPKNIAMYKLNFVYSDVYY